MTYINHHPQCRPRLPRSGGHVVCNNPACYATGSVKVSPSTIEAAIKSCLAKCPLNQPTEETRPA